METFKINGRPIGPGHPVYVVAELSANHRQDFDEACALIRAAKRSGADAVKVQTFTADTLTLDSDREAFRVSGGSIWDGKRLYDLYAEAAMPWEWQPRLKKIADEEGIHFFSSAFDATAVDFLEPFVPAYKIASCEAADLPLLERVARTRKPVILSTGMASVAEIAEALDTLRRAGPAPAAILKCTSAYPAKARDAHLRTIPDMAERFGVPVGWSDHTLSLHLAACAVGLGASIIEKHFIRSRRVPTPDSAFSLEEEEFSAMVRMIRETEEALGVARYGPLPCEAPAWRVRRSLYAGRDIPVGEAFSEKNVRSLRLSGGLEPKCLPRLLGTKSRRKIERGTPILPEDLQAN